MVSKKVIFILVVIAILCAVGAIIYNFYYQGKLVSTDSDFDFSTGQGKIGVTINPPLVEDKGVT